MLRSRKSATKAGRRLWPPPAHISRHRVRGSGSWHSTTSAPRRTPEFADVRRSSASDIAGSISLISVSNPLLRPAVLLCNGMGGPGLRGWGLVTVNVLLRSRCCRSKFLFEKLGSSRPLICCRVSVLQHSLAETGYIAACCRGYVAASWRLLCGLHFSLSIPGRPSRITSVRCATQTDLICLLLERHFLIDAPSVPFQRAREKTDTASSPNFLFCHCAHAAASRTDDCGNGNNEADF